MFDILHFKLDGNIFLAFTVILVLCNVDIYLNNCYTVNYLMRYFQTLILYLFK